MIFLMCRTGCQDIGGEIQDKKYSNLFKESKFPNSYCSHGVVRSIILPFRGKDVGSNPAGSILFHTHGLHNYYRIDCRFSYNYCFCSSGCKSMEIKRGKRLILCYFSVILDRHHHVVDLWNID